MADPLFIADRDTVKKLLRMTEVPEGTDAMVQFDEAITEAGSSFWRRIGRSRIDELVAITPPVGNPSTEEEHLRVLAASTEAKMVRRHLLRMHAAQTKQGGSFFQEWNEEGAFRNLGSNGTLVEIRRLDKEIENAMQILAGEEAAGDETTIEGFNSSNENGPIISGSSVMEGGIFRGLQ